MDPATHEFLFTVGDRFVIQPANELLLLPGIPKEGCLVRSRDTLVFRSPLGEILESNRWEFSPFRRASESQEDGISILLRGVHKFDVPIGTEVYLRQAPPNGKGEQSAES